MAAKTGLPVPAPMSTKVPPGSCRPPYLTRIFSSVSANVQNWISPYTRRMASGESESPTDGSSSRSFLEMALPRAVGYWPAMSLNTRAARRARSGLVPSSLNAASTAFSTRTPERSSARAIARSRSASACVASPPLPALAAAAATAAASDVAMLLTPARQAARACVCGPGDNSGPTASPARSLCRRRPTCSASVGSVGSLWLMYPWPRSRCGNPAAQTNHACTLPRVFAGSSSKPSGLGQSCPGGREDDESESCRETRKSLAWSSAEPVAPAAAPAPSPRGAEVARL
mmetsp:Transcript_7092/g.18054  ORF Transcript_7092/g.18054 Transcript_7092/m.18054 type:complete len:287 (-) Transcript_7092:72-932(-)